MWILLLYQNYHLVSIFSTGSETTLTKRGTRQVHCLVTKAGAVGRESRSELMTKKQFEMLKNGLIN